MQARTILPFTSISQAPQLPPRQPVGMAMPASRAACSQSWPVEQRVLRPWGQWISTSPMALAVLAQQRLQIDVLLERIGQSIEQGFPLAAVVGWVLIERG